ncbi:MAG TPA: hypothetical protein VN040_04560 [Pseudosphingobacterium sp.]|nr:hypothetical protein [Pseudosphingobacterium sp.]
MSEQCSLYVQIKIKKEKLTAFFEDKPTPTLIDDNWLAWWDSRKMYSKPSLTDVPIYPIPTNGAIIQEFMKDTRMGCSENYDDESGIWYLGVVFFSENYTEILPMLAWLKSLANYQEEEERGVAIIYDFYWGDNSVMAYMEFSEKKALLMRQSETSEIRSNILSQATQKLESIVEEFQKRYEE